MTTRKPILKEKWIEDIERIQAEDISQNISALAGISRFEESLLPISVIAERRVERKLPS